MPVSPTWPGVYVQEISSGVRTITGVSTATALFVGYTTQGPTDEPTLCTSYSDFVRVYGEDDSAGDMTRQVKLFFLNGGTQCYIIRVASGTATASVAVLSQLASGSPDTGVTLTAKSGGSKGNMIRAAVTYDGAQPEDTFNLQLFWWETQSDGTLAAKDTETIRGMSMDSASGAYAPSLLTDNSKLVDGELYDSPAGSVAAGIQDGTSTAMYRFTSTGTSSLWTPFASTNIQISALGSRYVSVALPVWNTDLTTTVADIQTAVRSALSPTGIDTTKVTVTLDHTTAYRIVATCTDGNVFVRRGSSSDGAVGLMWGTDQGGIEVTRYASFRPVPNGVIFPGTNLAFFEDLIAHTNVNITLNYYDTSGTLTPVTFNVDWSGTTDLADILEIIRAALDDGPELDDGETWPWAAELWGYRLAILPIDGPNAAGSDDNRDPGYNWSGGDVTVTPSVTENVRYYSLGTTGSSTFTAAPVDGLDGSAPISSDSYDDAYDLARKEVDLFNLLVLPRSADESTLALEDLWANASIYCEERRALLLMEPPTSWSGASTPSTAVTSLRVGMSKQYAALYYPRIVIKEDSVRYSLGATGAVAGLMARIDGSRGVWKAPAGTEADLRGVVGLDELLSDRENGVLNPRAVNVIRSFPEGIICWGARTMDGDDRFSSEYKYVPIRRLAMYIEESLFRGLKWVVFEPNDEPLWAQIRLNVGAFMHGLFRQGAFQGKTPTEAYFVKCDSETTTQNDRNLGIVNIWVGFAPLKPAEFVILSLQQMAGQLEV